MAWKNVYFIGIGGIGMSAIARYYKFKGFARNPGPSTIVSSIISSTRIMQAVGY